MTVSPAPVAPAPTPVRPASRLALKVAAAAVVWWGLYVVNDRVWDTVVYGWAGLVEGSRWGEAAHFFFYDTVKIALLLTGIIFVIAVARTFITLERTRALLGGRREGAGNVVAAGLGVATPFCSCSAVPAFIGFVSAGVPLGMTLSFLIASPLVNEVAVVLLYGLFGWQVAALYLTAGLTLAVVAGFVLGRMELERWVEPFVYDLAGTATTDGLAGQQPSWAERVAIGRAEVRTILGKIWPYLLVGIGIGAAIHGWVPEDLFARWAGPDNPLAVPIAAVLGIPLYSNAAGVLPLVEALHAKGLPMGTVLAFMMSVVALSLPEMILLRRVLKPKLIATFAGVVAAGILAVGFLFNLIL
jgi:uncharacterized membrane protein YraQ (UPF0718 family)